MKQVAIVFAVIAIIFVFSSMIIGALCVPLESVVLFITSVVLFLIGFIILVIAAISIWKSDKESQQAERERVVSREIRSQIDAINRGETEQQQQHMAITERESERAMRNARAAIAEVLRDNNLIDDVKEECQKPKVVKKKTIKDRLDAI